MRLAAVLLKSLRELWRDPVLLGLGLVFAPFFVGLYALMFAAGTSTFPVLVLDEDAGPAPRHAERMIRAMEGMKFPNGAPMLRVTRVADRAAGEAQLRNRDALLLVIAPADFGRAIESARAGSAAAPTSVTFVGDLTNTYYPVVAILAMGAVDQYVQDATGRRPAVGLREVPLGASGTRTEFETYVPGLLVFAVILLIFLASMTVTREVEAGTLRRLRLTRMTAVDLFGGVSLALVGVAVAAVLLTFLTASLLGFHSRGPLWAAVLVGAVTAFGIIGAGLVVSCFARTVAQAFVISNFPMALFMFFSSAIFPMPRVPLFTAGGHTVSLYDVLPTTHAVVALHKVLALGSGIGGVAWELGALVLLSALYFGAGVWLFQRTHLVRD